MLTRELVRHVLAGLAAVLMITSVAVGPVAGGAAGTSQATISSSAIGPGVSDESAQVRRDRPASVTVTSQAASTANGKATIDGWVRYQNQSGDLVPARRTDVILRKRTTLVPENKEIARTKTNESGYYSFQVDVSNWESNIDGDDRLRLRVQALAQNPAVNVVNFGKNLDTANGNTYTVNNDGSITRGDPGATFNFSIRTEDERRAFQIANWTLEEFRFTRRETGWTRKQVRARYPAVNNDQQQFKSFLEKFVIGNNTWNRSDTRHVIHHEYGHAVMSGLFGYKGWQIPHTSTWFSSHCIWSETHRLTSWYEGWAEFMEATTVDDPGVHEENIESYQYYNDSDSHSNSDCPASDTGDFDGVIVEGAIANILWDVYDPADEPHDSINGSLGEVFDAVNETDNRAWGRAFNNGRTRDVHMFFIQYVDNTGRHEALRKIYFEYGINKPDRFEHAPGSGSSCTVAGYPCAKLSAKKWTRVSPNSSIDVGLHSSDDDYYKLDLKEEQRATVNATVTGKAPPGAGDMYIVVGQSKTGSGNTVKSAIGTRTENYPHEEVTFTAPENGTYYVHIRDGSSRYGGNLTYTLAVNATPQPPQTFEQDDTRAQATGLSPYRIGQHIRTIERTAATARHDDDYYNVSLGAGDRISHASLRNAGGLNLTLEDATGSRIQRVANNEVLTTTTDVQGNHFFRVHGDARVRDYTLNVTVQEISQKYEENDGRSAAADLDQPLDLIPDPMVSGGTAPGHRGDTRWCKQSSSNTGNSAAGNTGNVGGGVTRFQGPCPRHHWWQSDIANPGFAPHEEDWYSLTLSQHERLNITIPNDRLGVELYAGGRRVASTAAGSPDRTVDYTARSAGKVFINVTGVEYVPDHDLRFTLIDAAAHDRFEGNDEQATATVVTTASSGNRTVEEPLLKLANGDADYFAVNLAPGDWLNATVTHLESGGRVELAVIDPTGSAMVGTDPRGGFQTYTTKLKRVTLTAGQSGTHYVKVSGSADVALKYNLTIETGASKTGTVLTPIAGGNRFEFEGLETGQWFTRDVPTPEEIARAGMFAEIGFKPDVPVDDLGVQVAVRDELPDGVPSLERAALLGEQFLTVDANREFDGETRITARVSRDRLREHEAGADDLVIFRHSGAETDGEWERLKTTVVAKGEGSVVAQATAEGMSVFAVGLVSDAIYDLVESNRAVYNRNVDRVPGVLRGLFAGERITLVVSRENRADERVGIVLEGERIQSVREGGLEDPTLVVRTSESTIEEIRTAEAPTEEALEALSNGGISYHGVGLVNGVKYTGVKIAVGVMEFVGDTLGVGPFG